MHSKAQEHYTSARVSVRCSELTATIGDLGTYDNEVCCLLFKCARKFFQRISLCGDPHNFEEELSRRGSRKCFDGRKPLAMRIGDERFRTLGHPRDRTPESLGRPQRDDFDLNEKSRVSFIKRVFACRVFAFPFLRQPSRP
jgi:hypothetical protein